MKIQSLLEVSSLVFHTTGWAALPTIAKHGTILLSGSIVSKNETNIAKNVGRDGRNLYYLSLSRNLHNAFNETLNELAVFEFSGHLLTSKYGKIVPVNFFKDVNNRGEMEDRLISDEPYIKITDCSRLLVSCSDKRVPLIKHIIDKYDIPVVFFKSAKDLKARKNGMSYDERINLANGVDASVPYDSKNELNDITAMYDDVANTIEKFLDGRRVDDIDAKIAGLFDLPMRSLLWKIRIHDPARGHELMKKIRDSGFGDSSEIQNLKNRIVAKFKGSK